MQRQQSCEQDNLKREVIYTVCLLDFLKKCLQKHEILLQFIFFLVSFRQVFNPNLKFYQVFLHLPVDFSTKSQLY